MILGNLGFRVSIDDYALLGFLRVCFQHHRLGSPDGAAR